MFREILAEDDGNKTSECYKGRDITGGRHKLWKKDTTKEFIISDLKRYCMESIDNVNTDGRVTTALFRTDDVAKVNLLRRAILSEIETHAIDYVIFQTNTSPRHDEILALRLGQLVIDHSSFNPPEDEDVRVHIDVEGPVNVTTEHIPDLPFKYVTPIVTLRKGQRIICDCIVKKGQGKTHVKWRPVSTFSFKEVDEGYIITINDIGMLPGPDIIRKGLAKIEDAARRPPITIFSHPLIPANIQ